MTLDLDNKIFIQFCEFNSLPDIGFTDKRSSSRKEQVPLEETHTRILFLTKEKHKCQAGKECTAGDIMLNVLEVDPYHPV